MSIDTLFKLTQQQAKIDDFLANLKKNPLPVTKYKNMVLNAGLDPKETTSMIGDIPNLKEKGFIIDDIKATWEEHKANTPKGHIAVKNSTFKQLAGDDFQILSSVKFSIYDDIGGGHDSKVTHYSANNGLDVSCGRGAKPYSVNLVSIDGKNPDDVAKFNKAQKSYENTMKNWESRKKDILEGRGKTLKEWFPLPQSIVDKENAVIEKQQRAEYKAWQKVQENNNRPRVVDNTNWTKNPHRRYLNK